MHRADLERHAILSALRAADIRPCVSVPCKELAPVLRLLESDPDRMLVYPAREEEGLGICAGAYLAGCFPVMIIQNSGLGNLVNAYCSLNQFFEIPVFFLISHRGTAGEQIDAQKPMGAISTRLLDLLGVPSSTLESADRVGEVLSHLNRYRETRRSHALLLPPPGFWS